MRHLLLKGNSLASRWIEASENFRPIKRFTSKTVLIGLEAAWFFAASPTSLWPSELHPTYDGVILFPCSLGQISTLPFFQTATQLQIKISWGACYSLDVLKAVSRSYHTCTWFLNQSQCNILWFCHCHPFWFPHHRVSAIFWQYCSDHLYCQHFVFLTNDWKVWR